MTDRATRTFAEHIKLRREQLRLSKLKASAVARVKRHTWMEWERDTVPQDKHYAGLEEALRWEPGSVRAILAGGQPTEREPDPAESSGPDPNLDPLTGKRYTDAREQALWKLRSAFAMAYIRELGEQRANELGAEHAREHIRLYRMQRRMGRRVA